MRNNPEQQTLPGINPKKLAYESLLKDNPLPDDMASAERFLRSKCDTILKLRPDYDYLRVVLKMPNVNEDKEKHEYSAELSRSDRKDYERRFLEIAVKAYYSWLDLEGEKYNQ